MKFTNADRQVMALVAIRLFEKWGVADEHARAILGGLDDATYRRWKVRQYGKIPKLIEPRLTALMGVHWGLRLMFSDPQRGYTWMSRPNALFNDLSPRQLIAGGDIDALIRLKNYLIAQTQPW